MKKVKILGLILMFGFIQSMACNFKFDIEGEKKEAYKVGDEVVILVRLALTHRVCPIAAQETKFSYEGLKIAGATDWKEEKKGLFTRKLKATVVNDGKKEIKLTATRTCDKDGGYGVFTLKKQ